MLPLVRPTKHALRGVAGAALRVDGWRLLTQLRAKVNDSDPFFLNFAWDGVGYPFLSPDGTAGKFPWTR
jgi:hypothetical protein